MQARVLPAWVALAALLLLAAGFLLARHAEGLPPSCVAPCMDERLALPGTGAGLAGWGSSVVLVGLSLRRRLRPAWLLPLVLLPAAFAWLVVVAQVDPWVKPLWAPLAATLTASGIALALVPRSA